MKFGVHLPHRGRSADRSNLIRFAQEAESLGFASLWTSDHIAWPDSIAPKYPYNETGEFPAGSDRAWLDCIGTLLFVAALTERIQLGTSVLILGYRPPLQTAKLLTTLDQLSEGRAVLGVGVGWMEEEFKALGIPFHQRGRRADETLEVFETLFREPSASFDGQFISFNSIGFEPKPFHDGIPVWVGGHSRAAYRRAARFGEAFHTLFLSPPGVADQWAAVRAICDEAGRDPKTLQLTLRLRLRLDQEIEDIGSLHGGIDQIVDRIGRYSDVGVSHITMDVADRNIGIGGQRFESSQEYKIEGQLEIMKKFVADVIPQLT